MKSKLMFGAVFGITALGLGLSLSAYILKWLSIPGLVEIGLVCYVAGVFWHYVTIEGFVVSTSLFWLTAFSLASLIVPVANSVLENGIEFSFMVLLVIAISFGYLLFFSAQVFEDR